jgi:hypothetical protein
MALVTPPVKDAIVDDSKMGIFSWLDWFHKVYYAISTLTFNKVNTATIGAVTINAPTGRVNIAAGQTTIVVTNNLCNLNSLIFPSIATNDATALIKNVISAAGSFTIRLNAAATANTAINFFMTN